MKALVAGLRNEDVFAGERHHLMAGGPLPDGAGCRVAVMGDPVGLADVVPRLVGTATLVKVFHRTPTWVLPRTPRAETVDHRRWIDPRRAAEVADAWVRRQLTPDPHRSEVPVVHSDDF